MAELQRNVEFPWVFKMVDETNFASAETGLTVTVTKSEDGNAFAALTGTPSVSEISSGWYTVTVAAADMDADQVVLRATATGAAPTEEKIYLQTTINSDLNDYDPATDTVDVGKMSGSATAADNLETAALVYNAERGLAGTALPIAAADAAGGLPISTAGGVDMDALAADAARLTAARAQVLTDWIDAGRLDAIIDAILVDTGTTLPAEHGALATSAKQDTMETTVDAILVDTGTTLPAEHGALATSAKQDTMETTVDAILVDTGTTIPADIAALPTDADVKTQADAALVDIHLDHLLNVPFDHGVPIGDPLALWNVMTEDDGGGDGSPQFTTKSLENGPGGAASGRYEVLGSCVQDDDGKLYWCAWLEFNGQPVTTGSNCRVDTWLLDGDGTITDLSLTGTQATDDDHGMFNGTLEPTIESGMEYKIRVRIAYGGSDYVGFIPFAAPVRATA